MYVYIYETHILLDFVLNKNEGRRNKAITRDKHPERVAQRHKLAPVMKKRKLSFWTN